MGRRCIGWKRASKTKNVERGNNRYGPSLHRLEAREQN
jgi:hypothetical protein